MIPDRRSRTSPRAAAAAGLAALLFLLFVGPAHAVPVSAVALSNPAGLAIRGDELVAAEAGKGQLVSVSQAGQPTPLVTALMPGSFTRGPTGVAVDGSVNAYVAVAEDGTVRYATPSGETGVYARGLGAPAGVAFDDSGNLYVADQAARRILRVAPDRSVDIHASGFSASPYGLAFGPDGLLYVSTLRDGAVWRVSSGGGVDLFASTGSSAEGLAFDASGNLYVGVGDAGEVARVAPDGSRTTAFTGLAGPLNLAFSGSRLYVAAEGAGSGTVKDRIVSFEAGTSGLPLAAPAVIPTSLPELPPHAVVHGSGAVALDPAPYAGILPQAAATDVGRDAAEPTIGVTAQGTVFYAAATFDATPVGVLARTEILRSRDRGKTWEEVTPGLPAQNVTVPPTTLDPYLYVDPRTSRVFTVDLYGGCSMLSYSDNEGGTWITNPVACGIPDNDHQTISAGPTSLPTVGYGNAVYYCAQDLAAAATIGSFHAGCGRSLDGGLTFEPAGFSYPPLSACRGLHGHVAVGPDGTVYVPKGDCADGPSVSVSRDSGTTWTRVTVAPSGMKGAHHEAHVATDAAGNAYYLWVSAADRLPYLAVSRDRGATWSAPMMAGPPGLTEANLPTIAAGDAGRIAILYMGTSGDCCYDKAYGGHTMWHAYLTVSLNALDTEPVFLTTTINDPRDPLRRGTCGPGRCGNVFDFLEVVVDGTGRPWASITDTCTGTCAKPGVTGTNNDGQGFAGQLVLGPRLVGDGSLDPPPWYSG